MTKNGKNKSSGPRIDRRYKNPDKAPVIVSEKRLTFFMAESMFRELRLQSGRCQVQNASATEMQTAGSVEAGDHNGALPETPSALSRLAIDFWLDQFRPAKDRVYTDREWEEVVNRVRTAMKG